MNGTNEKYLEKVNMKSASDSLSFALKNSWYFYSPCKSDHIQDGTDRTELISWILRGIYSSSFS